MNDSSEDKTNQKNFYGSTVKTPSMIAMTHSSSKKKKSESLESEQFQFSKIVF